MIAFLAGIVSGMVVAVLLGAVRAAGERRPPREPEPTDSTPEGP